MNKKNLNIEIKFILHIAYFQDQQKRVQCEKERNLMELQKEKERREIVIKELLVRTFSPTHVHLFTLIFN